MTYASQPWKEIWQKQIHNALTVLSLIWEKMNDQLSEIKQLLLQKEMSALPTKAVTVEKSQPSTSSIWFNKERLETVKAPAVPSVLVVAKTLEADNDKKNMEVVEKVIMEM